MEEHDRLLLEGALAAFDAVLGRVWMVRPGDLCSACPMRSECPDRTRCLHLVQSAGVTERTDGPFRRFPIGAREVGKTATLRTPFVARADLAESGIAERTWLELHRVRSFVAVPLLEGGRCDGVLALFSRRELTDAEVALLARAAARPGQAAMTSAPAAAPPARIAARTARGATTRDASAARTLAEIEREAIEHTLERTRGRVSGPDGAARLLGLHPSTLTSRMLKLGVRRPRRG